MGAGSPSSATRSSAPLSRHSTTGGPVVAIPRDPREALPWPRRHAGVGAHCPSREATAVAHSCYSRKGAAALRAQPSSLKRLCPAHEVFTAHDLSRSKRPHRCPLNIARDLGVSHAPLRALHADHGLAVWRFDDLLDLMVKPADHLPDLRRPLTYPVVAPERPLKRKFGRVAQLNLFVKELKPQLRRVFLKAGPADQGRPSSGGRSRPAPATSASVSPSVRGADAFVVARSDIGSSPDETLP